MAKQRLQRAKKLKFKKGKAKNVILFVGDGMGISTLTAARILEGQLKGMSGEENLLSFEQFPSMALSRTYSAKSANIGFRADDVSDHHRTENR